MWLVHLCCVIASFLVNMLFLNIKSGLFIIRLFFPTERGTNLESYTNQCNKLPAVLALGQQGMYTSIFLLTQAL
jgi:hypothetical protein